MFSSDSLQLCVSAVQAENDGKDASAWLGEVRQGRVVNEANGLNLDWMFEQFRENEILDIGRHGLQAAGRDSTNWS
jgi:hypothetical protein